MHDSEVVDMIKISNVNYPSAAEGIEINSHCKNVTIIYMLFLYVMLCKEKKKNRFY